MSADSRAAHALRAKRLVQESVRRALSVSNGDPEHVRRTIEEIQGPEKCNFDGRPQAELSSLNGAAVLVTAWVICGGGFGNQPVLDCWARYGNEWRLIEADVAARFKGHRFEIWQLSSAVRSQLWFLAGGLTIGNSAALKEYALYAFDGQAVEMVGSPISFEGALRSVDGDVLTTDWIERDATTGRRQEPVVRRYRATINGLVGIP